MVIRFAIRWLFHFAAALSLLLLLGVLAIWVRSQSVSDIFYYRIDDSSWSCNFGGDGVEAEFKANGWYPGEPQGHTTELPWRFSAAHFDYLDVDDPYLRHSTFLGCHFVIEPQYASSYGRGSVNGVPDTPNSYDYVAFIPFTWLAALSAVPAIVWVLTIRQRMHKPGCCRGCRYDLRVSTGKCPECGRAIPVPK